MAGATSTPLPVTAFYEIQRVPDPFAGGYGHLAHIPSTMCPLYARYPLQESCRSWQRNCCGYQQCLVALPLEG